LKGLYIAIISQFRLCCCVFIQKKMTENTSISVKLIHFMKLNQFYLLKDAFIINLSAEMRMTR